MAEEDVLSGLEGFDWDHGNTGKIWKKHRVDFRESEEIFFNKPLEIFYDEKHSQEEERFAALGITDRGRKLAVIFTIRKRKIRVISARSQSRRERRYFDEKF
jgi:uncharacterized DUF497 family protein